MYMRTHCTTISPRILVYQVMQELYHQQNLRSSGGGVSLRSPFEELVRGCRPIHRLHQDTVVF